MGTFSIRPIRCPDDYDPIAAILNPTDPGSAQEMEAEDRQIPSKNQLHRNEYGLLAGFGRHRIVAEDEHGSVIGYAAVWRTPWEVPGRLSSLVCVHPAHRHQGIGAALVDHLERWAREQDAAMLQAELNDGIPDALTFVKRRGFEVDAHVIEMRLDLHRFDAARFRGAADRIRASGICLRTLADEHAESEASERKLYELYRETLVDNPGHIGALPPFEEWRDKSLDRTRTRPEWVFVAVHGTRIVGVSTLFDTDEPGVFYTHYTGVQRAYRGRGVALALKLLSIETAMGAGGHALCTETEAKNVPMQMVNRRLGYLQGEGAYRIVRRL